MPRLVVSITIFLGVELLPLGEPSSFVSLHPPGGVLRVSSQEMFRRLTPRVDLELPDLSQDQLLRGFFRRHRVGQRPQKQGFQDQHDASNQHSYERNLDHEDCVS